MEIGALLGLGQTALELGLIGGLTVLALFLSYTMLDVCDLSTDGCFTLGAAVGAAVAISGHPWLSVLAAMGAGMLSGLVTAFIQTKMGVDSLLAGIIGIILVMLFIDMRILLPLKTAMAQNQISSAHGAIFIKISRCVTSRYKVSGGYKIPPTPPPTSEMTAM